ncbi:MAG: dockerin type I domain-containing protein [Candidatus Zixiibacteriota bacterium]
MDPVDQNSASYMWISPVAAGDRITIVSLGGQLMNVISVSPDMLVGADNNVILWDGAMWNDALAATWYYAVSKNGSDMGTFFLDVSNPTTYTIPNHSFALDVITYRNVNAALCIRHTVYDSLGNIYSRPRFDVMTNANTWINAPIAGYEDGIYRSVVYGHRSDGLRTNVSTVIFMNYICGDTNNDGTVTIADVTLLSDFLFVNPGIVLAHPASVDVNCSGDITIGDISILIDHLFISGTPLNCCHHLT